MSRLHAVAARSAAGEFSDSAPLGGPLVYRYPAVMMPELQRALIEAIFPARQRDIRAFDPFVGSGTTLCEATRAGLDFTGVDINPLAVLVARVKAGPYHTDAFESAIELVVKAAMADRSRRIQATFPGRDKWYSKAAQIALSRLRRGIDAQGHAPTRRFLFVALAETARLSSNSRLTTVKLHIRDDTELSRKVDVVGLFEKVARRSNSALSDWVTELQDLSVLSRTRQLVPSVALHCADIRSFEPSPDPPRRFDLLITSPPYGDNTSTIPYGQASYLPLQWVAPDDLRAATGCTGIDSPYDVDRRSLGGSRRNHREAVSALSRRLPTFAAIEEALAAQPVDRIARVASFTRDLDQALVSIVPHLASGAWQVWTVGQRTVGGQRIPLDKLLIELLMEHGVAHMTTIDRALPRRRRAALRNDRSERMDTEQVVVLKGP